VTGGQVGGGGVVAFVKVTCTEADFVGSCTDVAVTLPVAGTMAEVNIPFEVILPIAADAVQFTPWVELVKVALN
jgi:hypothetical protein